MSFCQECVSIQNALPTESFPPLQPTYSIDIPSLHSYSFWNYYHLCGRYHLLPCAIIHLLMHVCFLSPLDVNRIKAKLTMYLSPSPQFPTASRCVISNRCSTNTRWLTSWFIQVKKDPSDSTHILELYDFEKRGI